MPKELNMKKAIPYSEAEDEVSNVAGTSSEEDAGSSGTKVSSKKEPKMAKTSIGDIIEDNRLQLREKAVAVRKHLSSQSLVRIMLPREASEAKDATQSFNINGFGFYIRKGVYQNVPEQIADMVSENYGQDARIVAEHPLNLNNYKAAAREFAR